MKFTIWVKQEVEVPDDILRECHAEACIVWETDTESHEGLLNFASRRGVVDLPDGWRIDDSRMMTLEELEEEIAESK